MQISSLTLQHFRNASQSFAFDPHITAIVGENARGKTNILEAITLLSTGMSFRADRIEEMVQWKKEVARVSGNVEHGKNEHTELEVVLTTGMVQGEHAQKRKYLVDGVARRKKEFVGNLTTVLFRPEDMDMITGSPSLRRNFLNTVLSQADREYRASLDAYEKALKRRNALLDHLREGLATRAAFAFWDQLLIKHGNVISDKRRSFVDFLNASKEFPMQFQLEYDASSISEKRLHQYAVEEVAAGHTLVGPHKDDFSVTLANGSEKNLEKFGSRGEQRMGVLWLKIAEMEFLEQAVGERPVLLLDDIFSELDEKHREMVVDLTHQQQTIMTMIEDEFSARSAKQAILL